MYASRVVQFQMDLRTLNILERREGRSPPLPLGPRHVFPTSDASLDAAAPTRGITTFDDQIPASEQLSILLAPVLEGRLRANVAWPLLRFQRSEGPEERNGSLPQAVERQAREDHYENRTLADTDRPTWMEPADGETPGESAFVRGVRRHVNFTAPYWDCHFDLCRS